MVWHCDFEYGSFLSYRHRHFPNLLFAGNLTQSTPTNPHPKPAILEPNASRCRHFTF